MHRAFQVCIASLANLIYEVELVLAASRVARPA